eukprot:1149901-Pelagomonas_calceolata.AAC.3
MKLHSSSSITCHASRHSLNCIASTARASSRCVASTFPLGPLQLTARRPVQPARSAEGDVPQLDQDWREFRRKLLAQEKPEYKGRESEMNMELLRQSPRSCLAKVRKILDSGAHANAACVYHIHASCIVGVHINICAQWHEVPLEACTLLEVWFVLRIQDPSLAAEGVWAHPTTTIEQCCGGAALLSGVLMHGNAGGRVACHDTCPRDSDAGPHGAVCWGVGVGLGGVKSAVMQEPLCVHADAKA